MDGLLSSRLRYLRKKAGISQGDMAVKVGKSLSAYKLWEAGKNEPSISSLIVLADCFHVSLDWLCGHVIRGIDPSAGAMADMRVKAAVSILRDALRKLEG